HRQTAPAPVADEAFLFDQRTGLGTQFRQELVQVPRDLLLFVWVDGRPAVAAADAVAAATVNALERGLGQVDDRQVHHGHLACCLPYRESVVTSVRRRP